MLVNLQDLKPTLAGKQKHTYKPKQGLNFVDLVAFCIKQEDQSVRMNQQRTDFGAERVW